MTERELERRAQRCLAVLRHVEEVSFNVAASCRYYGISRQCYDGWLRRYQADGLDGLKYRSSRPYQRTGPGRRGAPRRGLINLADDVVATTNPAVAAGAQLDPKRCHPINQVRSTSASRAFRRVASDHPPA